MIETALWGVLFAVIWFVVHIGVTHWRFLMMHAIKISLTCLIWTCFRITYIIQTQDPMGILYNITKGTGNMTELFEMLNNDL